MGFIKGMNVSIDVLPEFEPIPYCCSGLEEYLKDFLNDSDTKVDINVDPKYASIRIRSSKYLKDDYMRTMVTMEKHEFKYFESPEQLGNYIIDMWNMLYLNHHKTNFDFLKDHITDEMLATLFSMDVYVNICKFCPAYDYKVQCDTKCDKHFREWLNQPVNYDECNELLKYLNAKENANEL